MAIKVKLGRIPVIKAALGTVPSITVQLYGVTMAVGDLPPYRGDYRITPGIDAQTMETANKYMIDNVTVKGIPVYSVSNAQGGNTVIIGGLEDAE